MYFLTNRNLNATRTKFAKRFNLHSRKLPAKRVIQHLVLKFEKTGSVHDNKRGKVGPKWSAHTPETVERARQILKESPAKSVRRIAQKACVLKSSLHRIVKEELHLYPYKIQMLHTLTLFSKQRRLAFAVNFRAYLADHPSALPHIWFSDEAHFWLSGHVNKQNCRIWSEENPCAFKTTELTRNGWLFGLHLALKGSSVRSSLTKLWLVHISRTSQQTSDPKNA